MAAGWRFGAAEGQIPRNLCLRKKELYQWISLKVHGVESSRMCNGLQEFALHEGLAGNRNHLSLFDYSMHELTDIVFL
jgi:hypothetical protein